ncbi:MAG TPA: metallophosphoesterase [Micromonosporaceae bacterium]|nr:metallophosphoesterase [Micromonosporaceae bacterium]
MPVSERDPASDRIGTRWRRWRHRVTLALATSRGHPAVRAAGRGLVVFLVALLGAIGGLLLNGRVHHDVGPFQAELSIKPSMHGETELGIPPLGSLVFDSHDAPASVVIGLEELDPRRTQRLISDPGAVDRASRTAVSDIESGLLRLAFTAGGSALLGALLLGLLVYRRDVRSLAATGAVAVGLVAGTAGLGYATFEPRSVEEPRYEGLLVNAPAVVGDARRIADRYDEYRSELQRLVLNVSKLYTTASQLPVYEPDDDTIRVLHVSDLHLNPTAFDLISTVAKQFSVDVVVDTGDITDWGSEREGALYASGVGRVNAPYVYVRGNHDSLAVQKAVARQDNAIVLDNHVGTVAGLTFAAIGDPRFTPDKSQADEYTRAGLRLHTESLVNTIEGAHRPVDVALVHDPAAAGPLAGAVPLVLAGHTHQRTVTDLIPGTLLMVAGSTGGAGLRGLQKAEPVPLVLSVLYFNRGTRALQAYDDITVGGAGRAEVTLQRHVVEQSADGTVPASPRSSG